MLNLVDNVLTVSSFMKGFVRLINHYTNVFNGDVIKQKEMPEMHHDFMFKGVSSVKKDQFLLVWILSFEKLKMLTNAQKIYTTYLRKGKKKHI